MPASPEVRAAVEGLPMLWVADWRRAVDQALDTFDESETLVHAGIAFGATWGTPPTNSDGSTYVLVTDRAVYFGAREKAGMFKKTTVSKSIPLSSLPGGSASVDRGPGNTYDTMAFLELNDAAGSRIAMFSFSEWPGEPHPLEQATAVGRAIGYEL